ncbi:class I SAM-dependent rRNA methyltransferase [Thermosulfidibacter takaii]|nr:class I SAM-dependent rRNA methyltransferase [Thermosulfidibacter takaii]
MGELVLKRKYVPKVRDGYPWIYKDWILKVDGSVEKGDEIKVVSETRKFLGMAYFNPDSYIAARVYSKEAESLDEQLISKRLDETIKLRDKLDINSSAFRVLFSEADGLPGLIVDWYSGVVVFQVVTFGLERRKDAIIRAIREVLNPRALVERKDAPGRHLEGLEVDKAEVHFGSKWIDHGRVKIEENGLKFWVDVFHGHKTGHYLDQRDNRLEVAKLAKGKKVLDCFCNTGGFGIYCAVHGADEVTGIDLSEKVLQLATENAELNRVANKVFFVKGNVFDELRTLVRRGKQFDIVILDPPSFTKSKKTLDNALKGYKDINVNALKLVKPGGFLVTASCSHHVTLDLFMQVVHSAMRDTGRKAKIVGIRFQAPDHPVIPAMPESLYLKLLIMEVL